MSHTEVAVDLLLASLFNLIHGSGFDIFHFWKKIASEVNRPVGEFTMTFQDVCMKSRNTLTQILLLGCLSRMERLDFAGDVLPQARDICSYLLHIPPKKTGEKLLENHGLKSATKNGRENMC